MSNENKEKSFPEGTAEGKELDTVPETDAGSDGEWQWDAAVPETQTQDITVSDLKLTEAEKAEEKEEAENEEEETSANSDDDGLCIVCGNPRGNSPSDLYCESCRKKFLRTNYGAGHIILAFVMVLVAAMSYFVCFSTCGISARLIEAESCISEKRYNDAVNACSAISSDVSNLNTGVNAVFATFNKNHTEKPFFVDGDRVLKIVLEAYADTMAIDANQVSTFTQYVENIIGVEELDKASNAKIKKVYDFCTETMEYQNKIAEDWQTFFYNDEKTTEMKVKYNEAIKFIDSCENDTVAKQCINEYYRAIAAFYAKQDKAVVFDCFDKVCELAGDLDYIFMQDYLYMAWTYEDNAKIVELSEALFERNINDTNSYYYAIKADIDSGNLESADERCEKMRKYNPDGLDYYYIKAELLRRMGKFEESVSVCKDGIAAGTDAEIYRQQAISYMLLEDTEAALEASKQAYDISLQGAYSGSQVSLEVINTAALIACIGGDNETYESIVALLEQQELTLEESVQKCIKGEMTFEEIFMEGTGDI